MSVEKPSKLTLRRIEIGFGSTGHCDCLRDGFRPSLPVAHIFFASDRTSIL